MPFTIVGVEPKGFAGVNVGSSSDVIIPLRARERFGGGSGIWNDAFATWIEIMGRVGADVTIERATEDLKLIFAQVNASEAQAAPANAFAARVSREAHLIVTPGARGRGQTRARPWEHLPVTARVATRAAWSNIGERLGGGACQHDFLLHLERGAGGRDGIPRRPTSAYRVQ